MEQGHKINSSHKIEIIDRKETRITNVIKLDAFNDKEFFIETDFGNIQITGSNMELGKMDTENKIININGTINSLKYTSKSHKDNLDSTWKKLFR